MRSKRARVSCFHANERRDSSFITGHASVCKGRGTFSVRRPANRGKIEGKKKKDGRRQEKEDKSGGEKGRRKGFDSLARSVIRATEFVSRDQGLEESTV